MTLQPHASGLCQDPSLQPITRTHVAGTPKKHVLQRLGTGQPQASLVISEEAVCRKESMGCERVQVSSNLSCQYLVLAARMVLQECKVLSGCSLWFAYIHHSGKCLQKCIEGVILLRLHYNTHRCAHLRHLCIHATMLYECPRRQTGKSEMKNKK